MGDQYRIDCPLINNGADHGLNGIRVKEFCLDYAYAGLWASNPKVVRDAFGPSHITSHKTEINRLALYPETGTVLGDRRGGAHNHDSFLLVHFTFPSNDVTTPS
jgi:hypothetical protein